MRRPSWGLVEIGGYLFLGGLAGGSSLLAAGDQAIGFATAAGRAKRVAASSAVVSLGLLVHDLGRPARFFNMMRVFKPTSPMSVGSWVLAGYVPAAIASNLPGTGVWRRISVPATCVAAALGPVVASYTAVLIGDTAIPAWHEGTDQLPTAFVSSAAMAAGGVSLALAPRSQLAPARRFGVVGAVVELVALERMRRRLGIAADAYRRPIPHRLMRAGQVLAIAGAVGAVAGRRSTWVTRASGASLAAASLMTRLGIFRAGVESADDPRFTVEPQRRRAD